jgi:hypothetical protein
MTYRNDLDALAARQTALETEVRDRTRELDDARRLVEEIQARARLPVLDNIRVAAPCPASWDAMTGDARVRACGDCKKNVYNLSELTRDEAEALIREKEGRLCVRYFQRTDGTILLKDCVVGRKRRRRRRIVAAGVAASLAGSGLAYHKLTHAPAAESPSMYITMGAFDPGPAPIATSVPPGFVPVQGGIGPGPELHEVKGDIDIAVPPRVVRHPPTAKSKKQLRK